MSGKPDSVRRDSRTLPAGTVTFMFTDAEDSTRLWEHNATLMRQALERHDALIEHAVERNSGVLIKERGEGDSHFAVFSRATEAVAAARDIQCALNGEKWPTPTPLRVRIALHTGEASIRDEDYYGTAVNRCARLRSVGHGGQVLLSGTTRDLVALTLPEGVELRDMGEHRLKDLQGRDRIYQLVIAGLTADFPPLRSLDSAPNNLPVQRGVLIGRSGDIAALRELVLRSDTTEVTLTGPGGTGKTRLALQVASELLHEFPDGAFFVDLSPISDPALVVPRIAQSLGLREMPGQLLLETLIDFLRERKLLLVIDNFEQVVAAAPRLGELTAACARVKILVTSRFPLRIYGEREYAVQPLGRPDQSTSDLAAIRDYPSVALFEQRAREVRADFKLTPENAIAVAELCSRLDGLPLAIELAAARVKVLPPAALLERLKGEREQRQGPLNRGSSLRLLTGGARDVPTRQQTLRGAIAWSYDLLDEQERRVFRAVSVFVGGFSLEAAEAVIGDTAFDELASLVDKHLMQQEPDTEGEPRFLLLETIREFGLDEALAADELRQLRRRHAEWCLSFAEAAEPRVKGSHEHSEWMAALMRDYDNLRAALAWGLPAAGESLSAGSSELPFSRDVLARVGLRLATALWWFWYVSGKLREGRLWLEQAVRAASELNVASPANQPAELSRLRAKALIGAGHMCEYQGDIEASTRFSAEGLQAARQLGDQLLIGFALRTLGGLALQEGNCSRARGFLEESLKLCREVNDVNGTRLSLIRLGHVAVKEGNLDLAQWYYEERLALSRSSGDLRGVAVALTFLAGVMVDKHDYIRATELSRESLRMLLEAGTSNISVVPALGSLARIAHHNCNNTRATRLLGALDRFRSNLGMSEYFTLRGLAGDEMADLRKALGDTAFDAAWQEGRSMSRERMIEYALENVAPTKAQSDT